MRAPTLTRSAIRSCSPSSRERRGGGATSTKPSSSYEAFAQLLGDVVRMLIYPLEMLVDQAHGHGPLADRRGHALDRPAADGSDRQHAGSAALKGQRRTRSPAVVQLGGRAGQHES